MPGPLKVLIIDDSPFSRRAIRRMLESSDKIEIAGEAKNGEEGIRLLGELKPDMVTLDLEMPKMDGFSFLRFASKKSPVPVLVISSRDEASSVFSALSLGASDFIVKPKGEATHRLFGIKEELLAKVMALTAVSPEKLRRSLEASKSSEELVAHVERRKKAEKPELIKRTSVVQETGSGPFHLVAIGSSTGGPQALQRLIGRLPAGIPASVVVAQHMPSGFTRAFAERLDANSHFEVKEAKQGDLIKQGRVLIAPGGHHMTFKKRMGVVTVEVDRCNEHDRYVPSVDRMFDSASQVYSSKVVGILLTGMGDDGKKGIVSIKKESGFTIAESEESSVVFGMPREAISTGAIDKVLGLDEIPQALISIMDKRHGTKGGI